MAISVDPIMLDSTGQQLVTAVSNIGATSIGNMSSLTTTDKTSLVGAVNELNSNKQPKTDNTLTTTSKTVVGAVNELKSGLTNVDVALSVPEGSGKNLLPMTFSNLKSINTEGTWSGNVYTDNDVTVTVQTNTDGAVTEIDFNGTSSSGWSFRLSGDLSYIKNQTVLSVNTTSGALIAIQTTGGNVVLQNSTLSANVSNINGYAWIYISNGLQLDHVKFYPMLRPATITDPTFAPYIPSVESRIEAVESLFVPKNKLLSTDNLNTIIKPQSYYWRGTDEPLNSPGKNSYMLVIKHSADTDIIRYIQIVYSFNNDKLYFRRTTDGGTNWGGWYTFDMTAVV